jgi:phosphoribosylformylglycinamidine (FGAM) synthase-like enzyme/phosphoribosylformylglycinamidine (FGAM) synthase PurS component
LTQELLVDPVVQEARTTTQPTTSHIVDVFFHAGVTDTLAESVFAGAQMLGITGLQRVETARRYVLDERLSEAEVRTIAQALLYNPVIQHYVHQPRFSQPDLESVSSKVISPESNTVASVPVTGMNDEQLLELSRRGLLALNLNEMRAIQQHYREQGREPSDVEMETLAQTWSEHCSHKTFKAIIEYREVDSNGNVLEMETIPGLLNHYIMHATEQVRPEWLVSAFSDNAGIMRFTETHDVAFKVETHNHPSAIEPFGGANTGVGGVIRDVLGVSAWPVACTDILCFGPPATSNEQLPADILSPRRIASGVVDGVCDYGNKMGIPTVNGAILYHEGYIYNPLVFCGCLGILPHGSHPSAVRSGDLVVLLGGRTGRDGVHGATFSSGEMSSETNAQAGAAVQIGAPITQKKVADVAIQARERRLYNAITDCGAGGFSSAIGEMGAARGVRVELAKAPLKYQGLAAWEIWISEAQERMVLAVPPAKLEELQEICSIEEVEISVIGTFSDDHRLVVTYQGRVVADMDMEFLHHGRPDRVLKAVWVSANEATATQNRVKADSRATATNSRVKADRATATNSRVKADRATATNSRATARVAPTIQRVNPSEPCIVGAGLAPARDGLDIALDGLDIALDGLDPALDGLDPALDGLDPGLDGLDPALGGMDSVQGFVPALLALLRHPTIGSKEDVVRRYDHEVQGATVLKPLVGRAGNGPGDAAVLQPLLETEEEQRAGIVISNGVNPLYGTVDPYAMALNAVDEALRNLTAVGGDITHAALLDNFCWGNPADPVQLGMLVRAVRGCHDAAVGFGTPFISGKDSLNNEYRTAERHIPVLPTLVISAVGVIEDAARTIDMALKTPGNLLYLVGETHCELGGSHYVEVVDRATLERYVPLSVPHVDIACAVATMKALGVAIRTGLVCSCHDLSEGGLAVAAAEMSLSSMLGVSLDISNIAVGARFIAPRGWGRAFPATNTARLFSESASRFLVEIAPQHCDAFEKHMRTAGVEAITYIGTVTATPHFIVRDGETELIHVSVATLQEAWKGGLA